MKHALVEINEGLILKISATSEASHVVAKAALNTAGARILYDALGEYLGLTAHSTGQYQRSRAFTAEDLTPHPEARRAAPTVRLRSPLGGVARLPRGGRK